MKHPKQTLDGAPCYEADELMKYTLGELVGPAREELDQHLSQCLRCRFELVQIRKALEASTSPISPQEQGELDEAYRRVSSKLKTATGLDVDERLDAQPEQERLRSEIQDLLALPQAQLYALVGHSTPSSSGVYYDRSEAEREGRRAIENLLARSGDEIKRRFELLRQEHSAQDKEMLITKLADDISELLGPLPAVAVSVLLVQLVRGTEPDDGASGT